MVHLVEFGELVMIELVYVVNEGIPLFCLFGSLMVDIFISFRVQHFFLVRIFANYDTDSYLDYNYGTPSPNQEIDFKSK